MHHTYTIHAPCMHHTYTNWIVLCRNSCFGPTVNIMTTTLYIFLHDILIRKSDLSHIFATCEMYFLFCGFFLRKIRTYTRHKGASISNKMYTLLAKLLHGFEDYVCVRAWHACVLQIASIHSNDAHYVRATHWRWIPFLKMQLAWHTHLGFLKWKVGLYAIIYTYYYWP